MTFPVVFSETSAIHNPKSNRLITVHYLKHIQHLKLYTYYEKPQKSLFHTNCSKVISISKTSWIFQQVEVPCLCSGWLCFLSM